VKLDSSKTDVYYLLLDLDDQQKREALEKLQKQHPSLYKQVAPLVAAEMSDQLDQIFQFTLEHSASQQVDYTNRQIDKYRILHEIGRGGMGVVYAACRADEAFEQKLAIKFLQSDLAPILSQQALFQEAQLLAKLNHPNIAKVFDGGIHNESVYIVMEQIEGQSLADYDKTQLNKNERLQLVVQLCNALEHSHQQGVVHGDLKPDNILIDNNQQVKLIDFNLTQKTNQDSNSQLIAFNKEYASPEQQSQATLTPLSDIYSVGKLLNWLFPNERTLSDLWAIQHHATDLAPTKRYSSIDKVRLDIEAVLSKRPVSQKKSIPFYPSLRLFQRNPITSSLCLLLALSGAFFTHFLVAKNQQLQKEKQIAENMIFEVSSMMFHSKSLAAQEMPLHAVVDLTRRRILANPEIPKHIKHKLLLVMMTPIEEKAAPAPTQNES